MRFQCVPGVCIALVMGMAPAPSLSEERTPEDTVRGYLTAFQQADYASAYAFVSKGMARDQDKATWVEEQAALVKRAEAQILEFTIYPGKAEGEVARVPNVLKSKDKLFNQTGAIEHELYVLIREAGSWKIDQQKLLVGAESVRVWFPPDVAAGVEE